MSQNTRELKQVLVTEKAKGIDSIILGGLPEGFDHKKITRMRLQGAKFEIWSYDGDPFLELRDIECAYEWDGVSGVRINATLKYRYLKPGR